MNWARQAYLDSELYFNILCAVPDTRQLRLAGSLKGISFDDILYIHFRKIFSTLSVDKLDESKLTSLEEKAKWREFCECYRTELPGYNMGTLLRVDSHAPYSAENSLLVPRVQFLAIELARNREGCNESLRSAFRQTASASASFTADSPSEADSELDREVEKTQRLLQDTLG